MTGQRSARGGKESTAGHYDPDAIGRWIMDPATQTYRYELPNVVKTGGQMAPGSGPPHRRRRRRKRRTDRRVADLVVSGRDGRHRRGLIPADVAVTGGRIAAVATSSRRHIRDAQVVDATGLLVLPGCVDVHTHTRLPSEAEPDRFFADSVAAAFGGTTTFLAFNNPGTGISDEGSRSLLAGHARVPRPDRGRIGGRLRPLGGHQRAAGRTRSRELPELIAAGRADAPRRSWSTTSA